MELGGHHLVAGEHRRRLGRRRRSGLRVAAVLAEGAADGDVAVMPWKTGSSHGLSLKHGEFTWLKSGEGYFNHDLGTTNAGFTDLVV